MYVFSKTWMHNLSNLATTIPFFFRRFVFPPSCHGSRLCIHLQLFSGRHPNLFDPWTLGPFSTSWIRPFFGQLAFFNFPHYTFVPFPSDLCFSSFIWILLYPPAASVWMAALLLGSSKNGSIFPITFSSCFATDFYVSLPCFTLVCLSIRDGLNGRTLTFIGLLKIPPSKNPGRFASKKKVEPALPTSPDSQKSGTDRVRF